MKWLIAKITEIVRAEFTRHFESYKEKVLKEVIKLDPQSTYILVVPDDRAAQELQRSLLEMFSSKPKSSMPNLVIVAAKDVSLIELTRSIGS